MTLTNTLPIILDKNITDECKVGINLSSAPTKTLDVGGDINCTGTFYINPINSSSPESYSIIAYPSTDFAYPSYLSIKNNNTSGHISLSTNNNNKTFTNKNVINNYGILNISHTNGSFVNTKNINNKSTGIINNYGNMTNNYGATIENIGSLKNTETSNTISALFENHGLFKNIISEADSGTIINTSNFLNRKTGNNLGIITNNTYVENGGVITNYSTINSIGRIKNLDSGVITNINILNNKNLCIIF